MLDYDGYVNKIEFGKTPERLMVNTLNRNQNEMKLYAVNPRSAMAKLIYTDKSTTWIDPDLTSMTRYYDSFFIVASERDGFRHLYQYSNAGSLMKQVTKAIGKSPISTATIRRLCAIIISRRSRRS